MAFIGNAVRRLFGSGHAPTLEPPKVTARDIVGSTTSVVPEAPELGNQKKRKGRNALIIEKEQKQASANSYKSLNI